MGGARDDPEDSDLSDQFCKSWLDKRRSCGLDAGRASVEFRFSKSHLPGYVMSVWAGVKACPVSSVGRAQGS